MRILRLLASLAIAGCAIDSPMDPGMPSAPAHSLDGLDSVSRARCLAGLEEFSEQETVPEGLGPLFNASSCAHCHNLGGPGGGGISTVLRVGCMTPDGFTAPPGGTLLF